MLDDPKTQKQALFYAVLFTASLAVDFSAVVTLNEVCAAVLGGGR